MRKGIITVIALLAFGASSYSTIINVPEDYPTIQQGIDASSDGDTVLVQPGTYVENINFNGHNIVLGSLFLITRDTTYIANTVVDGDQDGPVFIIENLVSGMAQIMGFTIQNGDTPSGIFCLASSITIRYCVMTGNTGVARGGGMAILGSEVIIENCKFLHNRAIPFDYDTITAGGGIFCDSSNVTLIRNVIAYNTAIETPIFHYPGHGAGLACQNNSTILLIGNRIEYNSAGDGGSGIDCRNSNIVIFNNIINGNSGDGNFSGGGVYCLNSHQAIINNIVRANGTSQEGCGISIMQSYGGLIINNIIRENLPNQILGSNVITFYSNIEGGWEGEGNIDVDPLFRDLENGDFHLMSSACGDSFDSPCIDAGDPSIEDIWLYCDWGLGELRSDMGAYGGGDSTLVGIDDYTSKLPDRIALLQNYPNPFNPSTTIRYSLPHQSDVRIEIYNILGQKVATLLEGAQLAGNHSITWNADDFPSGVYFARLQLAGGSENIKMVLLK